MVVTINIQCPIILDVGYVNIIISNKRIFVSVGIIEWMKNTKPLKEVIIGETDSQHFQK